MPLYVFVCSACAERFEELVRAGERAVCPACGSSAVERALPRIAVHGSSMPQARPAPGPCGSCGDPRGPGACAS